MSRLSSHSSPEKSEGGSRRGERWKTSKKPKDFYQTRKFASWKQVSDATPQQPPITSLSVTFLTFLWLYSSRFVPSGFTVTPFSPVSDRIVLRCYQILLVMVSFHHITIFVRVFAPSMLHSASCWDTMRGTSVRETFLCTAAQFDSHNCLYLTYCNVVLCYFLFVTFALM